MTSVSEARMKAHLDLTGDIMRTNAEAKLYNVTHTVLELGKLAKSLHKRYENACNYQWATTDKYERATERMEEKAVKLGQAIGITIDLQRDPRGWPLICRINMVEHRLG
jgi:hypothetical protein